LDEIEEFFGQEVMVTEDREHSREESSGTVTGKEANVRGLYT